MASIGISKAKAHLSELVKQSAGQSVVILVNNRPAAVLVGIEEYRALASLRRLAGDPQELSETADAYARAAGGDDSHALRVDPDQTLAEALEGADRIEVGSSPDLPRLLEELKGQAESFVSSIETLKTQQWP